MPARHTYSAPSASGFSLLAVRSGIEQFELGPCPVAAIRVRRFSLADAQTEPIAGAGAVYVSCTLLEAREQLYQLLPMLSRQPRPV